MLKFIDFFNEMAMKSGAGLALVNDNNNSLIAFQPVYQFKRELKQWRMDSIEENKYVYGIIALIDNTKYKSMEVDSIWAKSGYGPLMYTLAMTIAGEYGLMPNRMMGGISDKAKNVWKNFYSGSGKELVNSFDTDALHHQEDHLNKKYIIKTASPDYQNMILLGKRFFLGNTELYDIFIEYSDYILRQELDKIYSLN